MRYLAVFILLSILTIYNYAIGQADSSPTNVPQASIPNYLPQGYGQPTANPGINGMTPAMPAPDSAKSALCTSVAGQIKVNSTLKSPDQIFRLFASLRGIMKFDKVGHLQIRTQTRLKNAQ